MYKRTFRPWFCLQRRPYQDTSSPHWQRGEGKFEPITWDEAYKEIAEKLNHIKETDGPQAVAFSAVTINGSVRGCVVLPILWNYELWYRVQHLYDGWLDGMENSHRTAGKAGYAKL